MLYYSFIRERNNLIALDEAVTHDDDDGRAEVLADVFLAKKEAFSLK